MQLVGCLLSHFSIIVSFSVSFFITCIFFMQSNVCLSHRASLSLDLAAWTPMMSFNMFCPLYFLSLLSMEPTGNSQVWYFWWNDSTSKLARSQIQFLPLSGCRPALPASRLGAARESSLYIFSSCHSGRGGSGIWCWPFPWWGQKLKKGRAKPWRCICFCLEVTCQLLTFHYSKAVSWPVLTSLGHARNLSKPGEVTNNHEDMGVMWFVFVCSLVMLESLNHKGYKMVLFWSYHLSIFLRWVL